LTAAPPPGPNGVSTTVLALRRLPTRLRRVGYRSWLRLRYAAAIQLSRPTQKLVDEYFRALPDVYRIARNGDARFDAIVRAVQENVGECFSILDISCHEGYALRYMAARLAAPSVVGLDLSGFALEKARDACADLDGKFHQFDLTKLYQAPDIALPVAQPCDVVLVSELLYYVGPRAHGLWSVANRDLGRKKAFIRALQCYAHKAVILQHFGKRERAAIDRVAKACAGRLVDEDWGIYILDGLAIRPAE